MMLSLAATAAAALMASAASATTYIATYNVDAYGGSNGLDIETSYDASNPFTKVLNGNGATTTFDLFDIWTDEGSLDSSDLLHKDITVNFHFTAPGNQSGSVTGDTYGLNGHINEGVVTWDGPLNLNFGGTLLKITLSDETFNAREDDRHQNDELSSGFWYDADVQATLVQTVAAGVPEPASWALMIGGFGMSGAMLRRRRTLTVVA
jgi:opacity protein-like surface antigen